MKTHRFNLVLPIEIWKRISGWAAKDHRSVTQEIVVALEHFIDYRIDQENDEIAARNKVLDAQGRP